MQDHKKTGPDWFLNQTEHLVQHNILFIQVLQVLCYKCNLQSLCCIIASPWLGHVSLSLSYCHGIGHSCVVVVDFIVVVWTCCCHCLHGGHVVIITVIISSWHWPCACHCHHCCHVAMALAKCASLMPVLCWCGCIIAIVVVISIAEPIGLSGCGAVQCEGVHETRESGVSQSE